MPYKTVLAHLDGDAAGVNVLRVAAQIATRFSAHLVAVFGFEWPAFAVTAMDPAAGELLRYQIEWESSSREKSRAQVAAAEAATGLAIEWRVIKSDLVYNLALHARHADILVMGQDNSASSSLMAPMRVPAVAMLAGRPVLAVPYAGRDAASLADCATSVLLAWNGGRECARAVSDALPLLQSAHKIKVVSFTASGKSRWDEIPGADIALWLARHGVNVEVDTRQSSDADVGKEILSLAAVSASDLIVIGAYGHSRATEFVLGGATRTVLRNMTTPVLMSH